MPGPECAGIEDTFPANVAVPPPWSGDTAFQRLQATRAEVRSGGKLLAHPESGRRFL